MNAVLTLVERDYAYGAASLYNSLVRNGFSGKFLVGFRGLNSVPLDIYEKMKQVPEVQWIEFKTKWHFTNFKAQAILDIFDLDRDIRTVTYIDPDIVMNCSWNWMVTWSANGPSMCADVNWMMPKDHPVRHIWKGLLDKHGFNIEHQMDIYLNGGFLSIDRSNIEFVRRWNYLTETNGHQNNSLMLTGEIETWRSGNRSDPFFALDQDTLNMTGMSWEGDLTILGPNAMGFNPGENYLPHALGSKKPWKRKHVLEAIKGTPPRLVDKLFLKFSDAPIEVFPQHIRRFKKIDVSFASLIGRFNKRS